MASSSVDPAHPLLAQLRCLEVELHHPGLRLTRERLEQLLHPDFHEVGRSGRRYDRATVIGFLASHPTLPAVESGGFRIESLAPDLALLHYQSGQREVDGTPANTTLRMSLWQYADDRWQLRYHQGTPAADAG